MTLPVTRRHARLHGAPILLLTLLVFSAAWSPAISPAHADTLATAQAQSIIAKVPTPYGSGGGLAVIRDGDRPARGTGDTRRQYDSWDGNNAATEDWVGYTFASAQTFTRVVFQEGVHFWDGGWFQSLTVQVRQSGQWVAVRNLVTTPAYAGNNGMSFDTYTLGFDPIQGDGIRIYGAPGGAAAFVSVGELDVYVADAGSAPPPPPGGTEAAGDRAGAVDHREGADAVRERRGAGGDSRRGPAGAGDRGHAAPVRQLGREQCGLGGLGRVHVRERADVHARGVPGGRPLLGRRVVPDADGAGAAERAVGGGAEPGDHAGLRGQQRGELRHVHARLRPDPGGRHPDLRGAGRRAPPSSRSASWTSTRPRAAEAGAPRGRI